MVGALPFYLIIIKKEAPQRKTPAYNDKSLAEQGFCHYSFRPRHHAWFAGLMDSLLIHRHYLIGILAILGDRLIIDIIVHKKCLIIECLFDGADRHLADHGPGRSIHYLVSLIGIHIEGAPIIVKSIISYHRGLISFRQIADHRPYRWRNNGVTPSCRRGVITAIIIIIALVGDRKEHCIGCQGG